MSHEQGQPRVYELAKPEEVYDLRTEIHNLTSMAGPYEQNPHLFRTTLEDGGARTVVRPSSSDVGMVTLTESSEGTVDIRVQYIRPEMIAVTLPPFGSSEPNEQTVIDLSGPEVRTQYDQLTSVGCKSLTEFFATTVKKNSQKQETQQ